MKVLAGFFIRDFLYINKADLMYTLFCISANPIYKNQLIINNWDELEDDNELRVMKVIDNFSLLTDQSLRSNLTFLFVISTSSFNS